MLFSVLMACQNTTKKEMKPDFYTSSHEEDLSRIPLLEPMEVTSSDGEDWLFQLPYGQVMSRDLDVSRIDRIGVLDDVVVVHSESLYYDSQMTPAWIVINAANQKEAIATSQEAYEQLLKQNHAEHLQLNQVDKVFKTFDQQHVLPWREHK